MKIPLSSKDDSGIFYVVLCLVRSRQARPAYHQSVFVSI
jgi:hypothetical protein